MHVGIGNILARLKHELYKEGIDPEDVRLMVEGSKSIPKELRNDLKVKIRMMRYMVAEKMDGRKNPLES